MKPPSDLTNKFILIGEDLSNLKNVQTYLMNVMQMRKNINCKINQCSADALKRCIQKLNTKQELRPEELLMFYDILKYYFKYGMIEDREEYLYYEWAVMFCDLTQIVAKIKQTGSFIPHLLQLIQLIIDRNSALYQVILIRLMAALISVDINFDVKRDLIKCYIMILKIYNDSSLFSFADNNPLLLKNFSELLKTHGDYEFQVDLVEVIMLCTQHNVRITYSWFDDLHRDINSLFHQVSAINFDHDCRKFLNCFNKSLGLKRRIYSTGCIYMELGKVVLSGHTSDGVVWLDFNLDSKCIGITCVDDEFTVGKDKDLLCTKYIPFFEVTSFELITGTLPVQDRLQDCVKLIIYTNNGAFSTTENKNITAIIVTDEENGEEVLSLLKCLKRLFHLISYNMEPRIGRSIEHNEKCTNNHTMKLEERIQFQKPFPRKIGKSSYVPHLKKVCTRNIKGRKYRNRSQRIGQTNVHSPRVKTTDPSNSVSTPKKIYKSLNITKSPAPSPRIQEHLISSTALCYENSPFPSIKSSQANTRQEKLLNVTQVVTNTPLNTNEATSECSIDVDASCNGKSTNISQDLTTDKTKSAPSVVGESKNIDSFHHNRTNSNDIKELKKVNESQEKVQDVETTFEPEKFHIIEPTVDKALDIDKLSLDKVKTETIDNPGIIHFLEHDSETIQNIRANKNLENNQHVNSNEGNQKTGSLKPCPEDTKNNKNTNSQDGDLTSESDFFSRIKLRSEKKGKLNTSKDVCKGAVKREDVSNSLWKKEVNSQTSNNISKINNKPFLKSTKRKSEIFNVETEKNGNSKPDENQTEGCQIKTYTDDNSKKVNSELSTSESDFFFHVKLRGEGNEKHSFNTYENVSLEVTPRKNLKNNFWKKKVDNLMGKNSTKDSNDPYLISDDELSNESLENRKRIEKKSCSNENERNLKSTRAKIGEINKKTVQEKKLNRYQEKLSDRTIQNMSSVNFKKETRYLTDPHTVIRSKISETTECENNKKSVSVSVNNWNPDSCQISQNVKGTPTSNKGDQCFSNLNKRKRTSADYNENKDRNRKKKSNKNLEDVQLFITSKADEYVFRDDEIQFLNISTQDNVFKPKTSIKREKNISKKSKHEIQSKDKRMTNIRYNIGNMQPVVLLEKLDFLDVQTKLSLTQNLEYNDKTTASSDECHESLNRYKIISQHGNRNQGTTDEELSSDEELPAMMFQTKRLIKEILENEIKSVLGNVELTLTRFNDINLSETADNDSDKEGLEEVLSVEETLKKLPIENSSKKVKPLYLNSNSTGSDETNFGTIPKVDSIESNIDYTKKYVSMIEDTSRNNKRADIDTTEKMTEANVIDQSDNIEWNDIDKTESLCSPILVNSFKMEKQDSISNLNEKVINSITRGNLFVKEVFQYRKDQVFSNYLSALEEIYLNFQDFYSITEENQTGIHNNAYKIFRDLIYKMNSINKREEEEISSYNDKMRSTLIDGGNEYFDSKLETIREKFQEIQDYLNQ